MLPPCSPLRSQPYPRSVLILDVCELLDSWDTLSCWALDACGSFHSSYRYSLNSQTLVHWCRNVAKGGSSLIKKTRGKELLLRATGMCGFGEGLSLQGVPWCSLNVWQVKHGLLGTEDPLYFLIWGEVIPTEFWVPTMGRFCRVEKFPGRKCRFKSHYLGHCALQTFLPPSGSLSSGWCSPVTTGPVFGGWQPAAFTQQMPLASW